MKDPAFLFYPGDFLVGVSDLTMEERGQYITLLCIQHAKGRLTEKNIQLSVGTVSPDVLVKFEKDEDGCYYNSRLEKEIVKRERYSQSRRENGIKKWEKQNKNDAYAEEKECICKPYADAQSMHSENENINENININKDEKIDKNPYITSLFNKFWSIYPKKVDKEYAFKCFIKIENLEVIFDDMIKALTKHKNMNAWRDKRYIPNPSTWINRKRWEDEIDDETVSTFGDVDDFFNEALEHSNRLMGR